MIPKITVKQLQATLDSIPEEHRANSVTDSFNLARAIVTYYLGEDWFNKYVRPDTAKQCFFRIDESDPKRKEETAFRLIDLGEVLFNLQSVEGMTECVSRMRSGDLEGTMAELDLGRMLFLHQVKFRFVIPQGVKRLDYDVEIVYPDGTVACADAKCKIETTELTQNGLINAMKSARSQLPDNCPGIVFVKVPALWMKDKAFVETMRKAAYSFLRNTGRVVSVKFYVAPVSFEGEHMHVEHAYMEINNPDNRFSADKDWVLFPKIDVKPEWNGMPPWWQRILFFPDGKNRDL